MSEPTPAPLEPFEFIDLPLSPRDVEFEEFHDYLLKQVCSAYNISPEQLANPAACTERFTYTAGYQPAPWLNLTPWLSIFEYVKNRPIHGLRPTQPR